MEEKIRYKIREWYLLNKRQLPWREISDPYQIWVAEIIMQQTRVNQGLDYYYRFLEAFPGIEKLAKAKESEVLKVWEGLGYYSRARNMQAAAKYIYFERNGEFPRTFDDIIQLKGVGPYTAAAVSSIAFNEPRAVLDGNVHRVISRLYGIEEAPAGYRASSAILEQASILLDREDPGTHNQAVMELGALVCTPARPSCKSCPLQEDCYAYLQDRTEELPLRSKRLIRRKRYFHYLVIKDKNGIWLARRNAKDIWEGLFEFPLIETAGPVSVKSLTASDDWAVLLGNGIMPARVSPLVKHILSHQEIHAKFYHVEDSGRINPEGYVKLEHDQLGSYPMPKLILNYLSKLSD